MCAHRNNTKYYAVKVGFKPGIYTSWEECEVNIKGYSGALYKSFNTRIAAEEYLTGHSINGGRTYIKPRYIPHIPDTSKILMTNDIDKVLLHGINAFNGISNDNYYIFTDGSNQKSHSAYGVYFGNGLLTPYEVYSNIYHYASLITNPDEKTNNIAELKAIQAAITILINNAERIDRHKQIYIVSDSKYAINCISSWSVKWQRNGWRNSKNEPVANRELIEDIIEKLENARRLGLQIQFKHQLAHTAKPTQTYGMQYYLWLGNYMVDYLVQKKVVNK
jgi:ribonuclease HI